MSQNPVAKQDTAAREGLYIGETLTDYIPVVSEMVHLKSVLKVTSTLTRDGSDNSSYKYNGTVTTLNRPGEKSRTVRGAAVVKRPLLSPGEKSRTVRGAAADTRPLLSPGEKPRLVRGAAADTRPLLSEIVRREPTQLFMYGPGTGRTDRTTFLDIHHAPTHPTVLPCQLLYSTIRISVLLQRRPQSIYFPTLCRYL